MPGNSAEAQGFREFPHGSGNFRAPKFMTAQFADKSPQNVGDRRVVALSLEFIARICGEIAGEESAQTEFADIIRRASERATGQPGQRGET